MMKKAPLILGFCFLVACNFFYQEKDTKIILITFGGLLQESLKLYRINATFLGDDRYNDSLPDFYLQSFWANKNIFCFLYRPSLTF